MEEVEVTTKDYDETCEDEIKELLIGRRVVATAIKRFPLGRRWPPFASGRLTLDDDTYVYVVPNEGGCSCGSGDYELIKLTAIDNAISHVELMAESGEEAYGDTVYRIHVVAEATENDLIVVTGNDGDGYYGTGYSLHVVFPEKSA